MFKIVKVLTENTKKKISKPVKEKSSGKVKTKLKSITKEEIEIVESKHHKIEPNSIKDLLVNLKPIIIKNEKEKIAYDIKHIIDNSKIVKYIASSNKLTVITDEGYEISVTDKGTELLKLPKTKKSTKTRNLVHLTIKNRVNRKMTTILDVNSHTMWN